VATNTIIETARRRTYCAVRALPHRSCRDGIHRAVWCGDDGHDFRAPVPGCVSVGHCPREDEQVAGSQRRLRTRRSRCPGSGDQEQVLDAALRVRDALEVVSGWKPGS
jgi:hypothetical protein